MAIPSWNDLNDAISRTERGRYLQEQRNLREIGLGNPHPEAKKRSFGSTEEPRVVFYK